MHLGGMYGTEPVLTMAPPAQVFLALLICHLMYAVPAAFMTVDLATAYPLDGRVPLLFVSVDLRLLQAALCPGST